MTTIVYAAGVMASDSRSTIGRTIDDDNCKKIYRLSDGAVVGFSGDYVDGLKMLDLLKAVVKSKKLTLPSVSLKCQALLVKKKEIWYYEKGFWEKLRQKFYSIGTGGSYARVALEFGATAKEAVKAGISKDIYSGGRIQTLRI